MSPEMDGSKEHCTMICEDEPNPDNFDKWIKDIVARRTLVDVKILPDLEFGFFSRIGLFANVFPKEVLAIMVPIVWKLTVNSAVYKIADDMAGWTFLCETVTSLYDNDYDLEAGGEWGCTGTCMGQDESCTCRGQCVCKESCKCKGKCECIDQCICPQYGVCSNGAVMADGMIFSYLSIYAFNWEYKASSYKGKDYDLVELENKRGPQVIITFQYEKSDKTFTFPWDDEDDNETSLVDVLVNMEGHLKVHHVVFTSDIHFKMALDPNHKAFNIYY
jgi:hypothetical protein